MVKFTIIKRIATIKEWSASSLELNLVKWGNNPEKYDLRRWEGDIPGKGVTMSADEMQLLFDAIGEELDLFEDEDTYSSENDFDEDGEEEDPVQEEIDYRSFFVHGYDGRCNKDGHYNQEEVIAVIQILSRDMTVKEVEVPAVFCQKCNAYYISEQDYLRIAGKGRLLCQLMSVEEYNKYKKEMQFGDLKPQSILHIIGYNVSAVDNFSDLYRQRILSFAIDSGIITKKNAIGYLSFFIKMNEGNPKFDQAVQKWHRDRDFLTGYVTGKNRYVAVKRIVN